MSSTSCVIFIIICGPLIALKLKHNQKLDIILSSGFLAFSRQAGFLGALEDFDIKVGRIVGTSSGSVAASLFATGLCADEIAFELQKKKPIQYISPSSFLQIKRGVFELTAMTNYLRTILPKDFNDLKTPLAVGVFDCATKKYELITQGDLPLAVTASCAIPYIFHPIQVDNPPRLLADGGVIDRTGVSHWMDWVRQSYGSMAKESEPKRSSSHCTQSVPPALLTYGGSSSAAKEPYVETAMVANTVGAGLQPKALVHLVGTSLKGGQSAVHRNTVPCPDGASVFVVNSPKAKANFLSLRDYETQRLVAYACTAKRLVSADFSAFMRDGSEAPESSRESDRVGMNEANK